MSPQRQPHRRSRIAIRIACPMVNAASALAARDIIVGIVCSAPALLPICRSGSRIVAFYHVSSQAEL